MNPETKLPVRLTEAEALLLNSMEMLRAFQPPPKEASLHGHELVLTLDEIDDLVERLRDEVVLSGFDADYALNKRGRILEDLADRLFSRFLMSRSD